MLAGLIMLSVVLLSMGVVYPLCAILVYPIYRAVTGDHDFFQYLKNL